MTENPSPVPPEPDRYATSPVGAMSTLFGIMAVIFTALATACHVPVWLTVVTILCVAPIVIGAVLGAAALLDRDDRRRCTACRVAELAAESEHPGPADLAADFASAYPRLAPIWFPERRKPSA